MKKKINKHLPTRLATGTVLVAASALMGGLLGGCASAAPSSIAGADPL